MSNSYTVIGFDQGQLTEGREGSWVEHVEAMTPTHAAAVARKIRAEAGGGDSEWGICVIAVFEGRHADQYEPSIDTRERAEAMDAEMMAEARELAAEDGEEADGELTRCRNCGAPDADGSGMCARCYLEA